MDFSTQTMEIRLFKYLLDTGCCLSCCLRFIGIQTPDYFQNPVEHSKKLQCIDESFDNNEESPCIACLGILQTRVQEEVVQQIIKTITVEDYDSPTFTCALSIPVSLKPRERSLEIAIQKEFELTEIQLNHLKFKKESIKEVWRTQVLAKIEAAISKKSIFRSVPSPFLIDISLIHKEDENDCRTLLKKCDPNFNERRNQNPKYSRNNIEKVLLSIDDEKFTEVFSTPPTKPTSFIAIEKVSCSHASIFIGGRYNKYSRQLSQTPWFINGERKMETSVQDLLCTELIAATRSESVKFLSSGREDVDVRTINSGRPFAVELLNPRRTIIDSVEMKDIRGRINSSTHLVQIMSDLKILNAPDLRILKEGENQKTKFYRALCAVKSPRDSVNLDDLGNFKNLKIMQKTPVRVLHRRTLVSRLRVLHSMRGRWLTEREISKLRENSKEELLKNLFVFDVKTQAGTYVKEFVHGDFGRTKPSLCDLLNSDIDIVALDVTGINLHWLCLFYAENIDYLAKIIDEIQHQIFRISLLSLGE